MFVGSSSVIQPIKRCIAISSQFSRLLNMAKTAKISRLSSNGDVDLEERKEQMGLGLSKEESVKMRKNLIW